MAAALLAEAWLAGTPGERRRALLRRLRFAGLDVDLPALVRQAALGAATVRRHRPGGASALRRARAASTWPAPASLPVPSGRAAPLTYADDGTVVASVKLQELFGLAETPALGPSGCPVTFSLLAPNGRPVQTTRDLRSFWQGAYQEVRRELRGRYPEAPVARGPVDGRAHPSHHAITGQTRPGALSHVPSGQALSRGVLRHRACIPTPVKIEGAAMFCSCHSPWKRLVILAAAALALSWMAARGAGLGADARRATRRPGGTPAVKLRGSARTRIPIRTSSRSTSRRRSPRSRWRPAARVRAWTYNGGLPGPLIRTKVGDRLIVHFMNELDEPTTMHWHGVRVPIEMDGVPGISQPEVKKGESFTYDFVVRDASLYWYHPHVMSAAQVGFGLYGALLVEDPADGVGVADQIDAGAERHRLRRQGHAGRLPTAAARPAWCSAAKATTCWSTASTRPTLRARAGAPQRWRIVNAAKSRFF